MAKKIKRVHQPDPAWQAFHQARQRLEMHPLFCFFMNKVRIIPGDVCPKPGWAFVSNTGTLHVKTSRVVDPEDWVYVLAHCITHLGFGHFQEKEHPVLWNAACDCFVMRFLGFLKVGRLPIAKEELDSLPGGSEEALYHLFVTSGVPPELGFLLQRGPGFQDMLFERPTREPPFYTQTDWESVFARGISSAVSSVVEEAANSRIRWDGEKHRLRPVEEARRWFMSNYPLLGALAAGVALVEDRLLCGRVGIRVAAVNPELQEIYINPSIVLSKEETRFVIAHELLHLGLSHHARCQGRDPFLWNVACDYVINGWLVEMGIGDFPLGELLYDSELKGLSAESIYDRIVTDIRRYRRLATLRGVGMGDILEGSRSCWWQSGKGLDLDAFYRRSLAQGLEYHEHDGRGFLPAGLIEEIRALSQPPIPWDVALARWFEDLFPPVEKRRSYARPSRRQASTPDIPRPSWVMPAGAHEGRTFGVILDTSGSMDRALLAKALGAIAGYSLSREVLLVRVVFCDATYYDQGYMSPEVIADRVRVKGRGGTVLQPAIDFLCKSLDFPRDGPLLVITDGQCDSLRIFRKHAFLIPRGKHLPFVPKGSVFYLD